jgi:D-lyxose ketol-isomerase
MNCVIYTTPFHKLQFKSTVDQAIINDNYNMDVLDYSIFNFKHVKSGYFLFILVNSIIK